MTCMSSMTPVDVNKHFNLISDLGKGSAAKNKELIVCIVDKPRFDLAHSKDTLFKACLEREGSRFGRGAICLFFV